MPAGSGMTINQGARAHSPNDSGVWHSLADHLRGTSQRAGDFAAPYGGGAIARAIGLLHDTGKVHPLWQEYLAASTANPSLRGHGPEHKLAGVLLALRNPALDPFAFAIAGHHGGMPSAAELKNTLRTELDRIRAAEEAIALARAELPELAELETATIEGIPPAVIAGGRTSIEHFIRMVFSALVDADFLDTEAHFDLGRTDGRTGNDRSMADLLARFLAYYEKRFGNAEGTLAGIRREIFEACLVASEAPPSFFRLAVPTGGGKTLAGLVFALQHAVHHGKRRVIFAVPYLSITEQTAAVYRGIFPEDGTVLEHHSGFHESSDEEYASGAVMWSRLAAENWDAPVIVTTTVQLLESLFAHRPSRARKLHNIAGSVIVLDEVQSLPGPLLTPTLDMLRELVDHYGVTVVFSSATQPAYEVLDAFREVSATPIVPEPERYYRALKRVTYEARLDHRPPWDEVAGWLADEPQALAIVNTKKDALALLDALDAAGVTDVRHLSTLLCGTHRSDTIEEIGRRLRDKEPCIVVST